MKLLGGRVDIDVFDHRSGDGVRVYAQRTIHVRAGRVHVNFARERGSYGTPTTVSRSVRWWWA